MIDALYIIGAIASIGSAIYAWNYANNAKKYAERSAEQIANQRRISELSELDSQWNETYKSIAIFGSGARVSELSGKNPSEAARIVQDYLVKINKYQSSFQEVDNIEDIIKNLDNKLVQFSKARSGVDLKASGSDLLNNLSSLNSKIHKILTALRENINLP